MPTTDMVEGVEFQMGWRFKEDSITPKDLTGFSVLVQIRQNPWSSATFGSWTEADSEITFNAVNGSVDLYLTPSNVANLSTQANPFCGGYIDCLVYDATDGDRSPTYTIRYHTGVSRNG